MIIQICVGSSCHLKGSADIVQLMQKAVEEKRAARVKRAAGTRVNFFTMVRGED